MRKTILFIMALTFIQFIPSTEASAEEGYFLSLSQKGDLVWLGRMEDAKGDWYDIRIVPGYVAPTRMARKYLAKTGADFAEYVSSEKYRDLGRDSLEAFTWGYKDALVKFTLKGAPKAWRKHFSAARKRTEKRVFGWWFAYPWAFFVSLTDNAFRIPLGIGGFAGATAWGSAVVPAYHLSDSTVKGAAHFTVGGLILPASGYAWNTVISPPLALFGQKPAPSRSDGFWVRRLEAVEIRKVLAAQKPMDEVDLENLAQWGRILDAELEPFQRREQQIRLATDEAMKQVYKEQSDKLAGLAEERKGRIEALLRRPEHLDLVDALQAGPMARIQTQSWRDELRAHLQGRGGKSEEGTRLIRLLQEFKRDFGGRIRPIEKTDPVQHLIHQPGDL